MTIKIKYDYVEFNTICVGKLGKFKYTLIQKRVNNMFVTPDICTYDLITNELTNIILTMILIIENKRRVAMYSSIPSARAVSASGHSGLLM